MDPVQGPHPHHRFMDRRRREEDCQIPECGITNFTKDWNDGRALGALVDAIHPGLNPGWRGWRPADAIANTRTAMDLADDNLGVAKVNNSFYLLPFSCSKRKRCCQLMEPEEMVNPKVDELSVMTYLSQYPNAKYQPRPRTPSPPPVRHANVAGPGYPLLPPIHPSQGLQKTWCRGGREE